MKNHLDKNMFCTDVVQMSKAPSNEKSVFFLSMMRTTPDRRVGTVLGRTVIRPLQYSTVPYRTRAGPHPFAAIYHELALHATTATAATAVDV